MLKKKAMNIFLFCICICFFACDGGKMEEKKITFNSIDDVTTEAWKTFGTKKIYFGHQSVGANIISGMNSIIKNNPNIKLKIVSSKEQSALESGIFLHSSIGKNNYPQSKIDEFKKLMNSGMGNNADIAFFKFCFDDILEDTDVDDLFESYSKTMDELSDKYMNTRFVYVTVPLLVKKKQSFVGFLKSLFGKKNYFADEHNIARTKFNNLIRKKYGKTGRLFDLALYESTGLNGISRQFKKRNNSFFALVSEYARDGAHLNEVGQKVIAGQFLLFLVNMN